MERKGIIRVLGGRCRRLAACFAAAFVIVSSVVFVPAARAVVDTGTREAVLAVLSVMTSIDQVRRGDWKTLLGAYAPVMDQMEKFVGLTGVRAYADCAASVTWSCNDMYQIAKYINTEGNYFQILQSERIVQGYMSNTVSALDEVLQVSNELKSLKGKGYTEGEKTTMFNKTVVSVRAYILGETIESKEGLKTICSNIVKEDQAKRNREARNMELNRIAYIYAFGKPEKQSNN